ncbi:zinc finger protein 431-like [Odontomachus brunneus]|uniref:zinc finger protein 431-like n=1 Tax=Odontomachus brunneus TaxID=486640 RepID=UPI0013F26CDB|nr:zinc finger protein 431-like [Odontomachus brunneus]
MTHREDEILAEHSTGYALMILRILLSGQIKRDMLARKLLKPYRCSQCNRRYATNGSLSRHIRDQCQKKPQFKCQIKRGMLARKLLKPYRCSQCNRCYATKTTYNRHIRNECQKEPQFKCWYCHYASHQYCNLQRHILKRH